MDTQFIYQLYPTGEKNIAGYMKDGEPVIFTNGQIEELKKLSEDEQEAYALKLKGG